MKSALLVFAGAFALSLGFGASSSGCVMSPECECPEIPARPEPQGPLADLRVTSYDEQGGAGETDVDPESGTMEVSVDGVVIVYQQASVEHRVVYAFVEPSSP
jgi:hypothetical protein